MTPSLQAIPPKHSEAARGLGSAGTRRTDCSDPREVSLLSILPKWRENVTVQLKYVST